MTKKTNLLKTVPSKAKKIILMGLLALAGRNIASATVIDANVKDKKISATEVRVTKKSGGPLTVAQLNEYAKAAFDKKQYEKCIDLYRRIIITSRKGLYANACYMIGRAYMEMGVYDKALVNFELAIQYYNIYGVDKADKTIDYLAMYNEALQNAQSAQKLAVNVQKRGKSK